MSKRENSMKRLIVAAASVGVLLLALVGTTAAGASTAHTSLPRVRGTAAPVVTVSPNSNLTNGEKVTVTGSGWPAKTSLIVLECNADGAGPGDTSGSCDEAAGQLLSPKTSATGTFTVKYPIAVGAMKAGGTNNNCPQGLRQAQHSVECIIGVADLGASIYSFVPIHFAAPALTFTYTKSTVIGGHQSYKVVITEAGDYAPNIGGFDVIGAYGTDTPPSRDCQGSSNDSTVWNPPNLPPCTIHFGEAVEILWGGKKIGLIRVGVASPGAFTFTIQHAFAGSHTAEALDGNGEKATGTAVVP
jgi:hypothetical protein